MWRFSDGVAFDPFSFHQDGLAAPEVDIGRREVFRALVIAVVVVVIDETCRCRLRDDQAGDECFIRSSAGWRPRHLEVGTPEWILQNEPNLHRYISQLLWIPPTILVSVNSQAFASGSVLFLCIGLVFQDARDAAKRPWS